MARDATRRVCGLAIGLVYLSLLCSCGANEGILQSGKGSPTPANVESAKTSFAKELESVQTADFTFVYVLRRKDGGPIDAEDRGVIKLSTSDAARRVSADDGKAFIIGSNVQLPAKNMAALYERFAIDNYSQPPAAAANANAASNTSK